MLYRIRAGDREYHLVRASVDTVMKIAREKVWDLSPGEKVLVLRGRGQELIGEITRLPLFDEPS